MSLTYLEPYEWLEREFLCRKKRNPSYSLRRFAEQLEISSGRLSQYLSQKRRITYNAGLKIAQKIFIDPSLRKGFLDSVANQKAASAAQLPEQSELQQEEFEFISDPIHYSLLCLLETHDFQDDIQWMARRLGVSPVEVSSALKRLERLGFVFREGGQWGVQTGLRVTSSHEVVSQCLQTAHRENLGRIVRDLEDVPVEQRDVTSMSVAINSQKIPEAKQMIKEFRRKLAAFLEQGEQDEVYQINIQLFPVTRDRRKK